MKAKLPFKDLPKDYQGLLALRMLRPIHDKVDYANALEILDTMAGHTLGADQATTLRRWLCWLRLMNPPTCRACRLKKDYRFSSI